MLPHKHLKNFFLLTIFCAPAYLIKLSFLGIPTNVFELLMLVFVFISLSILKEKLFLDVFKNKLFLSSLILIFSGLILSIFSNGNRLIGLGILKGWFLIPMLFSLAASKNIDRQDDLANIFKVIFFSSASVGFISLFYKFFGIVTFDNRLTSFYLSPNHLAMYLAPGIIFGIFFCTNTFLQKKSPFYFFSSSAILLIMALGLYFTFSYGAWIALFLSLLVTLFVFPFLKKYRIIAACALLLIFGFLFFLQTPSNKFSDLINLSERSSISSRLTIWQVSLKLIAKDPFTGIGAGNFQSAYLSQQPNFPPYLEWAVPQPHNIFLAFWLQTGIIGLTGFLLLLSYIFSSLVQVLQANKNAALLTATLFAFFLYTIFHGMIDTTFWKNDLAFLFWICLFVTFYLKKTISKKLT